MPTSNSGRSFPGHLEVAEAVNVMEGSDHDVKLPLMKKKSTIAKSIWSADGDAADLFILLCSCLLTATSISLVVLIFNEQVTGHSSPFEILSILQRVVSSLSVTVTSAVIMVAGKRYVLFKLAKGGLRSRRVAVYCNPSIGNIANYLVFSGAELPLIGLSVVWGLALATGLTVNNSWEMTSTSDRMNFVVPSGSLDPAPLGSSWLLQSSDQLTFVMSSLCLGLAGPTRLINVTGANIATDRQLGIVYYPPLPFHPLQSAGFSFPATLNGFNFSMEKLPSVPSTAQNLTCGRNTSNFELWSGDSDNQMLSIVVQAADMVLRFNATAIITGGTLSSSGNYTEFALNGTLWPIAMPDNQWAQDISSLICNTTSPTMGICSGSSFMDFAADLNSYFYPGNIYLVELDYYHRLWSTILGMALGAYSYVVFAKTEPNVHGVPVTLNDTRLTSRFEIYILVLNIFVSIAMVVIVVRLRLTSYLGADFINSTRLLLDPLKKPELFNASLEATVDALADPYLLVGDHSLIILGGQRG